MKTDLLMYLVDKEAIWQMDEKINQHVILQPEQAGRGLLCVCTLKPELLNLSLT